MRFVRGIAAGASAVRQNLMTAAVPIARTIQSAPLRGLYFDKTERNLKFHLLDCDAMATVSFDGKS
jgi:hypothetical protein